MIRKYMISLLLHKMKSLDKTFTLVSAGFETCQDRQRRLLFDEKVLMWHAVVPCEHLNCRQVHDNHFFRRVWGTSVEEDEIWGQFLFKPRFHAECHIMVWSPIYLVSGTTIRDYIVSYLKEQVLVYQNQLSNLFCQVGWTKPVFVGSGFLTIKK